MTRTRSFAAAGILALGLLLGVQVRDVFSSSDDTQQFRKIEEAYTYITRSYAERVDSAQLAEDAIEGMLAGLDPHSIYISTEDMRRVRESFDASFDGIGIYYEWVEGVADQDTLVVLMPIDGGPSEEAGLQAGDRIVMIGDTTALGYDTDLVQHYLKGPKGTFVDITVKRPGYRELLEFTIRRDKIPLNTVTAAYMVDGDTGYIRLQRFARTSADEIRESITTLKRQGMERLVLDLRDNAGGFLDQAVAISDEFLPRGTKIVYTDSRHPNNRREYRAERGGVFENGPVIVLINDYSASASEIVAGALQDHDRALLVGRRSFGKGLVQQQFPLSDGSVLQMTVSKYYTPSGRLIQTPFELGEDELAYEKSKWAIREAVENRLAPNGGMVDADALGAGIPDSLVFETATGRHVYGGGGILPDYIVPFDTLATAMRVVIGKNLDNEFARVRIEQLGDSFRSEWEGRQAEFIRSYRLDDASWDAFLSYADSHGAPVVNAREDGSAEAVLVRSEALEQRGEIETRIKAFMARRLYNAEAWYPVIGQMDPVLQEAMRLWDNATSLAQASRR